MRDISTVIRDYYDNAAEPVTAAEILTPRPVVGSRRWSLPGWAFAAAGAMAAVVLVGVPLLVFGGSDGTSPSVPPSDTAPVIAGQVTTTVAAVTPTTSLDATPSTTSAWDALPAHIRAGGWHIGTYESVGYSCGVGQPDYACDAPHRVQYTNVWIGNDGPEVAVDFIDFFGRYDPEADPFPPDSPYSDGMLVGSVDDYTMAGLGHGVRVKQLDRAPPGLDIGGEAWIRLTISSLSAMDRADRNGNLVPTEIGYQIETGSEGDPLDMSSARRFSPLQWIESVVLVATNDTMSQWIIAFNQPGTYTYTASYWGMSASGYALNIRFVRL